MVFSRQTKAHTFHIMKTFLSTFIQPNIFAGFAILFLRKDRSPDHFSLVIFHYLSGKSIYCAFFKIITLFKFPLNLCTSVLHERGLKCYLWTAWWYPLVDCFAVEIPLKNHPFPLREVDGEITVEDHVGK